MILESNDLFVRKINESLERIKKDDEFKSKALVEIYKVSLKNAIGNRIYKDLYGELTPEIYAQYDSLGHRRDKN